jgi:hypothetical protein
MLIQSLHLNVYKKVQRVFEQMISLSLDRGIQLLVFIFTLLKELGEEGCPEFAIFLYF